MHNVTLMLSSSMVVQLKLTTNDRQTVTRDIIGNILSMILVWILFFFLRFL